MEFEAMFPASPKPRRSLRLFSDFNTLQFACVMSMVIFCILLVFMTIPVDHRGIAADLPRVGSPVSMATANRWDAMKVTVTRDGKVYFGVDQIRDADDLRNKIAEQLKDHGIERKVYVTADMRARWGSVKPVLDGVRDAGILRVAFMVNQYRGTSSMRTPLSR